MSKRLTSILILWLSVTLSTHALAWNRETAIGFSVVSLLAWNPMKLDGLGVDYGVDDDFERTRLLWLWQFDDAIFENDWVSFDAHVEFAFGQTQPNPQNVSLGVTPVLEWSKTFGPTRAYLETGLGGQWMSLTEHRDHAFSTHLQFSEIWGVGVQYKQAQLGLRYQHISNGDIAKPNNGYDFYGAVFKWWY